MGKKEFDAFVSGITRQRIASICLALGWNSVHQSSMEIMQDLLIRYIRTLGVGAQARAELCNRTQANILDIQRLFDDMHVNLGELAEYIEKVDDRAVITDPVPSFPAPSKTDLNFPKTGSQEVLHRKSHIEQYFPPMYPELEKEEDETGGMTNLGEGVTAGVKTEPGTENNIAGDVSPNTATSSGRILTEQESKLNPFREMDSVMMTSSGFISPAREGRLPDASRPAVSNLATSSIPQDLDSATPPATPTPPPYNQGSITPNIRGNTTNTPKKRGPTPGSKHKRKKESQPNSRNPEDSPDDLSGDETYEPPPGIILDDNSSSKKLSVFQRKTNKPRKQSPTKTLDLSNALRQSTKHSDGHVDDVIKKVIERGIEESARLKPLHGQSLLAHEKSGQPPGIDRASFLRKQSIGSASTVSPKQQPITPSPGPKKRGRKRKSELLKIEAEKASKSESSDLDICYDAPIRKKARPPIQNSPSLPEPPIELKIPKAPTLPPDPSMFLNNPLIPKVPYGFGNLSNFNIPSLIQPGADKIDDTSDKRNFASSFGSVTTSHAGGDFETFVGSEKKRESPFDKHERKKDKSLKKSKKDKNKDRDKNKNKEKTKERDREKGKEKENKTKDKSKDKKDKSKDLRRERRRVEKERLKEEKRERRRAEKEKEKKERKKKRLIKMPTVPPLFAPAEQLLPVVQSQPSVPKLKIKEIKPIEKAPKIVFKNVPGEQQLYPGTSGAQANILKRSTLKSLDTAEDYGKININVKKKIQKISKKKDKPAELLFSHDETIKANKKGSKYDKKERTLSGDTSKKKIKGDTAFDTRFSNPGLVGVDPGASSSNSPQLSGISSASPFVGGGTITTQTVGKYVDQGHIKDPRYLKQKPGSSLGTPLNYKSQDRSIRCYKCREVFPTKEAKKLHTCNSLLDQHFLSNEAEKGASRKGTEQTEDTRQGVRKIWVCPRCGYPEHGFPMIGCDGCDDWYHWVCVNLHSEPKDEDWYCPRCKASRARRSGSFLPTSNVPRGHQPPASGRGGRPPKAPKM